MMNLNIVLANDEMRSTLWLNGKKKYDSDDDISVSDILYMIEEFVLENGSIDTMYVEIYDLYKANTGDIPDHISSGEELCKWYLETTGEELK